MPTTCVSPAHILQFWERDIYKDRIVLITTWSNETHTRTYMQAQAPHAVRACGDGFIQTKRCACSAAGAEFSSAVGSGNSQSQPARAKYTVGRQSTPGSWVCWSSDKLHQYLLVACVCVCVCGFVALWLGGWVAGWLGGWCGCGYGCGCGCVSGYVDAG